MRKSTKETKKTSAPSKATGAKKEVKNGSEKVAKTADKTKSVTKKKTTEKAKNTAKPRNTGRAKSVAKKRTTQNTKKKVPVTKTTKRKAPVKKPEIMEYYDLPYRYNQTIVKILAQTPNTLFVYWDISDEDRKKYEEEYGKNFFEETVPVLIVHNKTMNYYFEIEVNDFANSWYFKVNDAKCDYEIELGRRAKQKNNIIPNDYLYVASSNTIEAPNNHILFEKNQKVLFFRNVKTNEKHSKEVSQFQFMKYIGRIYNIYDIYKKIYKNDELQDLEKKNPSSKM